MGSDIRHGGHTSQSPASRLSQSPQVRAERTGLCYAARGQARRLSYVRALSDGSFFRMAYTAIRTPNKSARATNAKH
jgi:hypothetical protein